MTKKVAIIQSNYIPWKGYFDIINSADKFNFSIIIQLSLYNHLHQHIENKFYQHLIHNNY